MSIASKRKYVTQEVDRELVLPRPEQVVVRVLAGKGNNLHQVEAPNGETFLVSMPTKFRRNVWVKRGDYVLCEWISEGDKVKAEMTHILYKDNIEYIKAHNLWPTCARFASATPPPSGDAATSFIDRDMLPPSESEEEDDDASDSDAGSAAKTRVYNPNYSHGPYAHRRGSHSDGDEEEAESQ